MNRPVLRALLIALALPSAAAANVRLGPLFCDHLVLQRDRPVPVWGWAAPGENVQVSFRGATAAAAAGPDGRWIALLPSLPANAGGADLVVQGADRLVVHDVVVGEVWLASGQSNMEFTVDDPNREVFRVEHADEEVAAAQYPLIRQFTVRRQEADRPAEHAAGSWAVCSPDTVPNFSAVGYFFARDLHRRLGVPVGIIDSTWGGTPIESWMSPMTIATHPAFAVIGERWRRTLAQFPAADAVWRAQWAAWKRGADEARERGPTAYAVYRHSRPEPRKPRGPGSPWTPMSLYDGMIDPLLPYGLRGVIWYQGESNADRPDDYAAFFQAMIEGWRAHLGEGDLPFLWVQLSAYADPHDPTGRSWARLREAQEDALSLPDTGEAVTIDIGDPKNIHPRNKQEVGRRLALLARAQVYGMPVDWSGPVFERAVREGSRLRLYFRFADSGLLAAATPLQAFEVAGPDKVFHPATAEISGDSVVVHSREVPDPVAVRYAWSDAPDANLYNGAGLPAVPFNSDP